MDVLIRKFTSRFTQSQRDQTYALIEDLGLVPRQGVTEEYIRACHREYVDKQQNDVLFRALVEERKENMRKIMRRLNDRRNQLSRRITDCDGIELTLFD